MLYFNETIMAKNVSKKMVQGAGFEPAKRLTADLESAPFDHSGTPAWATREDFHCSFFLFVNIQ